jgi:dolichol-phosphate mannosyltransferase
MKTLIAIPCYNCQNQIPRVIDAIENEKLDKSNTILLIDNRSSDDTLKVIKSKIENLSNKQNYLLFQNNENNGLGGSHKVAFNYAINNGYDYVSIIHGDDQARVSDYNELYSTAIEHKCSALGSRFMLDSKRIGYQKSRTFGNVVLNIIFTVLTLRVTKDLGSGINIFNVSDLQKIDFTTLSNAFNFNVDLLLSFYKNKIKVQFVPITWVETDQISNAKNFNVALSMLKSLIFWRIGLEKSNIPSDLSYTQVV